MCFSRISSTFPVELDFRRGFFYQTANYVEHFPMTFSVFCVPTELESSFSLHAALTNMGIS